MDRGCLLNGVFTPYHLKHAQGDGHFFPSSMDSQFGYPPVNGIHLFQEFHYFVVIDFEATCDKEKIPQPQEIIEFPSVVVNGMTGELEACFQTYVRPTCNQELTDFCKDLTGIQQNQVDKGVALSEALLLHDKWLEEKGIKQTNFAVVTWGDWDCKVMLDSECQYKKIRKPSYFNRWINLRVAFREIFGGLRCNLKQAVEIAGLKWRGRPHCGLDDAKNTARLLALLMGKGFKFSITNGFTDKSHPQTQELENQSFPLYQPHQKAKTMVNPLCFCGFTSSRRMVGEHLFFGCGNWAAAGGTGCNYAQFISQ